MLSITFLQAQETAPVQNPPEQQPDTLQPAPDKAKQPAPDASKAAAITPKKATPKISKKRLKKHSLPEESPIVVIRNGGTLDAQGQIAYSATDQQTLEKRKNTDSLLSATSTNLQKISGKQLNPNQQDMVKQIHNYMSQSKNATRNGDLQGANVLAVKAHLLSEELVKP